MKRIFVIYTGGTIGMVETPGGLKMSCESEKVLQNYLENSARDLDIAINFESVEHQIDSGEARPADWLVLANIIRHRAPGHDGVLVIHGTDTMPYAGAMLPFLLMDIRLPIVFTGAQFPIVIEGTDAHVNLRDSLAVFDDLVAGESVLVFGSQVLTAERIVKYSSQSEVAFATPGTPPVGRIVDGVFKRVRSVRRGVNRPPLALPAETNPRIDVITVTPTLSDDYLRHWAVNPPDGLVIELYGRGTAPIASSCLIECLEKSIAAGLVVVAISQCSDGGLDLGAYPSGQVLLNIGVIDGSILTQPAAVSKLWCAMAETPKAGPELLTERWCSEID